MIGVNYPAKVALAGDAAIVTHAGVMRALVGHWRRLHAHEWSRLDFAFGELVRLDVRQGAAP